MTREEICTYEVCKLAKEKGFPLQKVIKQDGRAFFYELPQSHPDWANCDAWYIPTQSLLQRWLREEKGVFIEICNDVNEKLGRITSRYNIVYDYDGRSSSVHISCDEYPSYELALENAIKYALENLV